MTEAHAATCTSDQCLIGGATGGKFTLWELNATTTTQAPGIPDIEVSENAKALAPVTIAERDVFVVPSGSGSAVLQRSGQDWSTGDGPTGTPVSAVLHGDELWVVTTDAHQTGTLWRSRVT